MCLCLEIFTVVYLGTRVSVHFLLIQRYCRLICLLPQSAHVHSVRALFLKRRLAQKCCTSSWSVFTSRLGENEGKGCIRWRYRLISDVTILPLWIYSVNEASKYFCLNYVIRQANRGVWMRGTCFFLCFIRSVLSFILFFLPIFVKKFTVLFILFCGCLLHFIFEYPHYW